MRVVQKSGDLLLAQHHSRCAEPPLHFVLKPTRDGPAERQRIYTDNKVIARNLAAGGQESWYLAGILTV